MWMFVEDEVAFGTGAIPDWVNDWMAGGAARQRGETATSNEAKSLDGARAVERRGGADPKAEARRQAAAEKRAQDTAPLGARCDRRSRDCGSPISFAPG